MLILLIVGGEGRWQKGSKERRNQRRKGTHSVFIYEGKKMSCSAFVKKAYQKIIFFLLLNKIMLWMLKRTVSMRWFFWAPKTFVKIDGYENIYNCWLNNFVYLNLWICFYTWRKKCLVSGNILVFSRGGRSRKYKLLTGMKKTQHTQTKEWTWAKTWICYKWSQMFLDG